MNQLTNIHCIGINHRTAAIELRERVRRPFADLYHDPLVGEAMKRFGSLNIQELVVVDTCNRFELYVVIDPAAAGVRDELALMLAEFAGCRPADLARHLYDHTGWDAAYHLSRVAAGLDSMVLGEPQILGQVAHAAEQAARQGFSGKHLQRLFRRAIRAGKRARSETSISHNPSSVSSIALISAAEVLGDLAACEIALVGLGQIGRLTLKSLHSRGLAGQRLINRTLQRAQELAEIYGGRPGDLGDLPAVVAESDLIFCATSASAPLITTPLLEQAAPARRGRPLVIIDLSLPRCTAPEAGCLPGVTLIDLDHLYTSLDASLASRCGEIPQVEQIIAEELATLEQEMATLEVAPLITDLREQAEAIRRREVARTLRFIGDVDVEIINHIDHLSRALVNKLLHHPTARLREKTGTPAAGDYSEAVRDLFGLPLHSTPGETDQ